MFAGRLTQTALRALDWWIANTSPPAELPADALPAHLLTGQRGEAAAFFYLRRRGYIIVARNYRSPHQRGDLDLVGCDGNVLCFIEVKTRTTRAVKPAQAAVDRDKQHELRLMARDFLRHLPASSRRGPQPARSSPPEVECRFDVLAVYYDHGFRKPSFELFQNAFPVSYNRGFVPCY